MYSKYSYKLSIFSLMLIQISKPNVHYIKDMNKWNKTKLLFFNKFRFTRKKIEQNDILLANYIYNI